MPAYKDKDTGKWIARFYYTDYQGMSRQKWKQGFEKKKDALAYERNFLEHIQGSPDMSFQSLWENYQHDKEFEIKETTWMVKQNLVNIKILPFLKEYPINEIDERVIRKWQTKMQSLTDSKGQLYSQTYLKRINNELSAILNHAVKYYKLPYNPMHVTGSIGAKNADQKNFWTLDQFNKAMDFYKEWSGHKMRRSNIKMYILVFHILFYTGIRVGELLALTANDISGNKMSITKTFNRIKGQDVISMPKTKSSIRTITVPSFIINMVNDYINTLYGYESKDRLFQAAGKSQISRQIQLICKYTGLPRIRTHDLRHSHASLLIKEGVQPKVIQSRLGHKDIQTTLNTYSHLWEGADDEVSDLLTSLSGK